MGSLVSKFSPKSLGCIMDTYNFGIGNLFSYVQTITGCNYATQILLGLSKNCHQIIQSPSWKFQILAPSTKVK